MEFNTSDNCVYLGGALPNYFDAFFQNSNAPINTTVERKCASCKTQELTINQTILQCRHTVCVNCIMLYTKINEQIECPECKKFVPKEVASPTSLNNNLQNGIQNTVDQDQIEQIFIACAEEKLELFKEMIRNNNDLLFVKSNYAKFGEIYLLTAVISIGNIEMVIETLASCSNINIDINIDIINLILSEYECENIADILAIRGIILADESSEITSQMAKENKSNMQKLITAYHLDNRLNRIYGMIQSFPFLLTQNFNHRGEEHKLIELFFNFDNNFYKNINIIRLALACTNNCDIEKYVDPKQMMTAALTTDNEQLAIYLFLRGLGIDAKNNQGQDILQQALYYKYDKLLEVALANKAYILNQDNNGNTIAHDLARISNRPQNFIASMIDKISKSKDAERLLAIKNKDGHTALYIAIHAKDINKIKLFVSAGADLFNTNKDGVFDNLELAMYCLSCKNFICILKKMQKKNKSQQLKTTNLQCEKILHLAIKNYIIHKLQNYSNKYLQIIKTLVNDYNLNISQKTSVGSSVFDLVLKHDLYTLIDFLNTCEKKSIPSNMPKDNSIIISSDDEDYCQPPKTKQMCLTPDA